MTTPDRTQRRNVTIQEIIHPTFRRFGNIPFSRTHEQHHRPRIPRYCNISIADAHKGRNRSKAASEEPQTLPKAQWPIRERSRGKKGREIERKSQLTEFETYSNVGSGLVLPQILQRVNQIGRKMTNESIFPFSRTALILYYTFFLIFYTDN